MIELKEITVIPTLMRWRAEVIEHVFGQKPDQRLLVANRQYYRNKGVGLAIVSALLDEAKAQLCEKIYLETTADGRIRFRLCDPMGFDIHTSQTKLKMRVFLYGDEIIMYK